MLVAFVALTLLALLGHAALWVGLFNRVHSTGALRPLVSILSTCSLLLLVTVPAGALFLWMLSSKSTEDLVAGFEPSVPLWIYLAICWAVGFSTAALWIKRRWLSPLPGAILQNHTTLVDVAAELGRKPLHGFPAWALSYVSGNQVLQLAVDEKRCALARLPTALDGLSITHLSDLHITGRIGIEFFRAVVRQTNALRSDMIVITGDLIDEVELFDWLPELFKNLSAPLGIYFVLGNHDRYTHQAIGLRQMLTELGFIDLGGRWRQIDAGGAQIVMAGNELPWFTPAPNMENCPPRPADKSQLRILLSHSPDQFGWARRCDFDLMLAGHTHGGQICLPLVGPIVSPSWHGVKYASGTFFKPPTLMHVSRGVSAELPIRLNCPPELTKLVLTCAD